MITLKEVITKKDLKAFVKFPFKLYKGSKYWVPPIISQEIKTFNKKENPVFKDADARLFLAYRDNEIVGRIAAIVNWLEVKRYQLTPLKLTKTEEVMPYADKMFDLFNERTVKMLFFI